MSIVKILPDVAKEKLQGVRPLVVGVKDVPIMRKWISTAVLTKQSAYVKLEDERGIHASRLMKVLKKYEYEELLFENHRNPSLVTELKSTHDTKVSWKCKWSTMELDHLVTRTIEYTDAWYMTLEVPYVSICPCAAEMCCVECKGIPHQQRSVMKVTIPWKTDIWKEDILPILTELFLMPKEIMTREQELDWCIRATERSNLVFTEDAARRIGDVLEGEGIVEYLIEVEHFESLHEHSMVAVNRKGRFV